MAIAGGYVLYLSASRRQEFEDAVEFEGLFSESVGEFDHAKSAPLICFACTVKTHITHIAKSKRSGFGGTNRRLINLWDVHKLDEPIKIKRIVDALGDNRTRVKATTVLKGGGHFSPKAFISAVNSISSVSEEARPLLKRFSETRARLLGRLTLNERRVLAGQKEALLTALSIVDFDKKPVHEWEPPDTNSHPSFLDGLPKSVLREDAMIANDLMKVPGWELVKSTAHASAVFEEKGKRLTVVLANRLPLEQLTGTDLIYFNESHRSFVMVQYKAMDTGAESAYFNLPNKDLSKQMKKMRSIEKTLRNVAVQSSSSNYRLHPGPFYIKLCSRTAFNPDELKLFPGMYFSLDHLDAIAIDPTLINSGGIAKVTYSSVGRHIDNDLFIKLVGSAWIGSHVEQSAALEKAIRDTLESGRAVALAVEGRAR